jgi:hypothetical protein
VVECVFSIVLQNFYEDHGEQTTSSVFRFIPILLSIHINMEYFSAVLAAFCLVTFVLSQFSLLDVKGWVTVFVSFCSLIFVQRSHVKQEKELEEAKMMQTLHQIQKAQKEKDEMQE